MSATVVLTPGYQFAASDLWTYQRFNLLGNPTVAVTFTFEGADNFAVVTEQTRTFTATDLTLDEITLSSAHSLSAPATVDDVRRARVTTTTTLPTGLTASTTYDYYIRPVGTDKFTLHTTAAGAINNTNRVDLTGTGSGTHTIYWSNFTLGQPLIFNATTSKYEKGIVKRSGLPEMIGATSTADGARGAAPQPKAGQETFALFGDGTYRALSSATGGASDLFNNMTHY